MLQNNIYDTGNKWTTMDAGSTSNIMLSFILVQHRCGLMHHVYKKGE